MNLPKGEGDDEVRAAHAVCAMGSKLGGDELSALDRRQLSAYLKYFGEEEFNRLADQASELSRKADFIRLQLRIGGELEAKGRLEASDLQRIAETVGVAPPAVKEFPPEDLWLQARLPPSASSSLGSRRSDRTP